MGLQLKTSAVAGLLTLVQVVTPAFAEVKKPLDGLRGTMEPSGLSIEAEYTGEMVMAHKGAADGQSYYLENVNVTLNWDLEKAFGISGTAFYMNVLGNSGDRPNDAVGTLEGVSNIEVADGRLKIYEFAFEKHFGDAGGLSFGYIDLNAQFYATEASGLLVGPPYGIGTELAATGSNGPAIFPSTSLALIGTINPTKESYVRLGVFGARAHNWGDPGSRNNLSDGILTIAEAGRTEKGLLALGAWRYSDKSPAFKSGGFAGSINPWGIYALVEQPLMETASGRAVTGFLRAGYSDGETSDFQGSVTAGILVDQIISGRPNSQFSLGVRRAFVSDLFKDTARLADEEPLSSESGIEIALADQLNAAVTLQSSLHYAPNPGAIRAAEDALISSVRLSVAF
jgi:porin